MCKVEYAPSPDCFPGESKCIILSDILSRVISNSIFLISCKNENVFNQLIKPDSAKLISSRNLINFEMPYFIQVENPNLTISVESCMGIPRYIDDFISICNLIMSVDIQKATMFANEEEEWKTDTINSSLKDLLGKLINSGSESKSILDELTNNASSSTIYSLCDTTSDR